MMHTRLNKIHRPHGRSHPPTSGSLQTSPLPQPLCVLGRLSLSLSLYLSLPLSLSPFTHKPNQSVVCGELRARRASLSGPPQESRATTVGLWGGLP